MMRLVGMAIGHFSSGQRNSMYKYAYKDIPIKGGYRQQYGKYIEMTLYSHFYILFIIVPICTIYTFL